MWLFRGQLFPDVVVYREYDRRVIQQWKLAVVGQGDALLNLGDDAALCRG
jgi:hypothetical protein